MTRTAAVVPAAGRGERLGPGAPKALRTLGGVPMLVYAVRALASARSIDLVVITRLLEDHGLLESGPGTASILVVSGGDTRQDSVARALLALPLDVEVVLVHDAARPLAPTALVDAVAAAVHAGADAVVPALPVADTIKRIDEAGAVIETVDRSVLRAVQTPQGFRRDLLTEAHAAADPDEPATDDAGLVEALGRTVMVIPGDDEALKVTRPFDLVVAEAVLARRRAAGVLS